MTVRDLIKQDIDIDVYDDVCEELGIAFCGPMTLTPDGLAHFADVLDYEVTLSRGYAGDAVAIVHVDDPDDDVWERKLHCAMEFFNSAAGYCSAENFDKWFEEV